MTWDVEQRIALAHLLLQTEPRIRAVAGGNPVDDFRGLPARLEVRPQRQTEAGAENDVGQLEAAQVQNRLLSP